VNQLRTVMAVSGFAVAMLVINRQGRDGLMRSKECGVH